MQRNVSLFVLIFFMLVVSATDFIHSDIDLLNEKYLTEKYPNNNIYIAHTMVNIFTNDTETNSVNDSENSNPCGYCGSNPVMNCQCTNNKPQGYCCYNYNKNSYYTCMNYGCCQIGTSYGCWQGTYCLICS